MTYRRTTTDDYTARRSALIPAAERHAYKVAGYEPLVKDPGYPAWAAVWNRAYFAEMDRLWAAEQQRSEASSDRAMDSLVDWVRRMRSRGLSKARVEMMLTAAAEGLATVH